TQRAQRSSLETRSHRNLSGISACSAVNEKKIMSLRGWFFSPQSYRKGHAMTRIVASLASAFVLLASAAAAPPDYKVIKRIPIGGEKGWDYLTLDSAARRLYIARADRVMVVDVDQGSLAGEVPNCPGIHGVALVPEKDRGYTSNGAEGSVTVFDLKTL